MEAVYIVGMALAMTLATGFFIFEIPLRGVLQTSAKKLREGPTLRKFSLLMVVCLSLSMYGRWLFGIGRDCTGFLLTVAYLLAVTPSDLRQHLIPDRASATFAVAFLLFQLAGRDLAQLTDATLGAVVGAVLLGLPYLIRRESIGLGDVKMVAVCGLMFGMAGVIYLLLRAFLAILVYSMIQLLRKKVALKTEIPFAPFLLLAAIV